MTALDCTGTVHAVVLLVFTITVINTVVNVWYFYHGYKGLMYEQTDRRTMTTCDILLKVRRI